MNGIDIVDIVASALVHFLWQGALAGLAAAGVLALLKNGRAVVRYAVATGFLLLMLALPAVTALRLADSPETGAAPVVFVGAGLAPAQAEASSAPTLETVVARSTDALPPVLPWVFGLWLAGVAALSIYHLGGLRVTRRLFLQGRAPGESLETLVRGLCRRLGIARAVILLESATVSVPTVMGWLRPVLLVPASTLAGLSPQQLEAILAHELAHVRRHDYLVNLLQTAVETLLFYHPAVWWVSTQVRRERENCCDDLAVEVCGDRLGYARALADLEGLRSAGPRLALAADGGSLTDRIRRLVGAPARRSSRRSWAAGLLALALLPTAAAIQLACSRGAKTETESRVVSAPTPAGRWSAKLKGDELELDMKMRKIGWGSWEVRDSYPVSQFTGLAARPGIRFELRRDAGTFRFQGGFQGDEGRGTVAFIPNPQYAKELGLSPGSDRMMELAVHDISFAYSREMKELALASVRRPHSRPGRDFVDGFRDLFRNQAGPVDRLVELRIHDITPEFIRGLAAAGYPDLDVWQLVELRVHDVDPAWLQAIRDAGYRQLPVDRIVDFQAHNITPEWMRGIVDAGYADIPPLQILDMHFRGVDGAFIRKALEQSHRQLTPTEILDLHARGGIVS